MNILDCKIFYTKSFHDFRGTFFQLFDSESLGFFFNINEGNYFQQNIVVSNEPFTFRGLHSQKFPFQQGKLVSCIRGMVIDVVIDLRKESDSYMAVDYIVLTADNPSILFVPAGCFHGYLTLCEDTIVSYIVDNVYKPSAELIMSPKSLELFDYIDFGKVIINDRDLCHINEEST